MAIGTVWLDLEAAERELGTPDGVDKLGAKREGTAFCPFSCNEARIVVAFHTDLPMADACASVLEAARRVSAGARKQELG